MPLLNDQLNSFKARMRNVPVLGKRTANPPPQQTANDRDSINPPEPKQAKLNTVVPIAAGQAGKHMNTQFLHAVEFLKKQEKPVTFEDLEGYLSSPVQPLIPLFMRNPHLKVGQNTVTYVSRLGVYSADDLMRYLQRMPTFQGVSVKELKDGWSGALPTIAKLEQEQQIIVLRNRKDDSPRLVWPNRGGRIGGIDPRFVSLWQSARVPSASELPKNLELVGLKPSSVDPTSIKLSMKPAQEKKRKQRAPRSKITNTHMKGLLKDFS